MLGVRTYQGQRVAEEHEARGVVGEVFGDVVEGGVDGLVFVLADLVGVLVDQVCGRGKGDIRSAGGQRLRGTRRDGCGAYILRLGDLSLGTW